MQFNSQFDTHLSVNISIDTKRVGFS